MGMLSETGELRGSRTRECGFRWGGEDSEVGGRREEAGNVYDMCGWIARLDRLSLASRILLFFFLTLCSGT